MDSACQRLFEYAVPFVTRQDIEEFSLSDPGYPDYVREWTQILTTRKVPEVSRFDISENIGTTSFEFVSHYKDDAERYLRFCVFTNAVAAVFATNSGGPDERLTHNCLAAGLIDCAHALSDNVLLEMLSGVFDEIHMRICDLDWFASEAPFFVLGQLILAYQGYNPTADTARLAERVILAEAKDTTRAETGRVGTGFLWDLSSLNLLHERWRHYVETSFPEKPGSEWEELLKDALLSNLLRHRRR